MTDAVLHPKYKTIQSLQYVCIPVMKLTAVFDINFHVSSSPSTVGIHAHSDL